MGFSNIIFSCMLVIWFLCSLCWVDATTTIIVGAGMSGIMAAKTLSANKVDDFVILEATDRIGGRMRKKSVGGYNIEVGANWVEGVGGEMVNPIWTLAKNYNLTMFPSDWDNLTSNIYNQEGGIFPSSVVDEAYDKANASSEFSVNLSSILRNTGGRDISILASQRVSGHVPEIPLEMAIDFFLYDFEIAEPPRITSLMNVEPIATFADYGNEMCFVADIRGYEYVVHRLAEEFLSSSNGTITDERLQLNKVVRKIEYSNTGVKISTEDGSVYTANNTIVSVSVGVLQTKLIEFEPDLPMWKRLAINKWDMGIYCKIFMKFKDKFWPTGPGTEFFMYAHERRGYFPFWQHLENEYPGGNLLMVTVTDDESRRIEQQSDDDSKAEIMVVLKKMFGNNIPEMEDILIPRWGKDRFYKGTYSNWPIGVSVEDFYYLKEPVGAVYFTGEHTSQKYNGFVHGAYLEGIRAANTVLECMNNGNCAHNALSHEKPKFASEIQTCAAPNIQTVKSQSRAKRKLGERFNTKNVEETRRKVRYEECGRNKGESFNMKSVI